MSELLCIGSVRKFWARLACTLFCWVGISHGQATINSFGVTYTAPGYVIASDATGGGANRHRIPVTATINFTVPGSYNVEWALLNPSGTTMANSTTVVGSNVSGIRTPTGNLVPASGAPLLPGVLYRLKVDVRDTASSKIVATATEAPGHTYLHFTGTDPASTARNVISEVTSVTVNRRYLLETDASRTTVPVVIGYTLHRYDGWANAPTAIQIGFGVTPRCLKSADGVEQAGTITANTGTAGVSSHNISGGIPVPASVSGTLTAQWDPSAILPPDEYYFTAQITHLEQLPALNKNGSTVASAANWIYHFTGALAFGSIATHFSALASAPVPIPVALPAPDPNAWLRITVPAGAGVLDGRIDHTWGSGSIMNIRLDTAGNATWQPTIGPNTSNPQVMEATTREAAKATLNGVSFSRTSAITLDGGGAQGSIEVTLPTGIGWAADRLKNLLSNVVDFNNRALNQNLEPLEAAPRINKAPGTFFLCEETKPIYLQALLLEWTTATGEFFCGPLADAHSIRQPLLDFMNSYSASYADAAAEEKKSNDFLYNKVNLAGNVRFKTGVSGGGELSCALTLPEGNFKSHFPNGAAISWSSSSLISVVDDLINTAPSVLNSASTVTMDYGRHSQKAFNTNCGTEEYNTITLTPNASQLKLTPDGGVQAAGPVAMDLLSWGRIAPAQYAHKLLSSFTEGGFLMAGTFLRGDQNLLDDSEGASILLLSGADPGTLAITERPASPGYTGGNANYAGMNFRTTGTASGLSTLNGSAFGNYSLTTRSKYYARYSGVTGIHEAPAGEFPGSALIGAYQFSLSSYGQSFLSNEVEDSRIAGQIDLPDPTDFTLAFNELRFTALGALESATLDPQDVAPREFDYWNAAFTPWSVRFEATNDCDPGAGTTLVMGFSAAASHLGGITGSLGIQPTGYFTRPSDAPVDGVPTRITLPGALTLTGTLGETYSFFPTQSAYLNHSAGLPAGEGFWSLFGTLDVPFFRNVEVNAHLRCTEGDVLSPVYFMGGWPDHGWLEGGGTPFNLAVFDTGNNGFPGASLASYREGNQITGENLPRAIQSWLGVIDLDYPLEWHNTGFNFTGTGPVTSDFIVVQTEHELDYLDAGTAQLHFGAVYEGLPEISLQDFVFSALDDATGAAAAFVQDAADEKVFNAIEDGVDAWERVLSDEVGDLLGDTVRSLTNPVIAGFTDAIKLEMQDGAWTSAQLKALVETRLRGPANTLATELKKLGSPTVGQNPMLTELDAELGEIEQGLDALIDRVALDPDTGEALVPPLDAILAGSGATRPGLSSLARAMVDSMTDTASASIGVALDAALADRDTSVAASINTLTETRNNIRTLRSQLQGTTGFGAELADLAAGAAIELDAVATAVGNRAEELVNAAGAEELAGIDALALEWQAELQEAIMDAIAATGVAMELQEAVKHAIYDLQGAFNSAVDGAFAALNAAIKDALRGALTEIDDTLEEFLGPVREVVKRGALTGFAHITGDSLKTIRLDGLLVLCVPDELKLEGFIEIREMDSNGPNGCVGVSEKLTEIEVGSPSVRLLSLSPECGLGEDVRAALSLKCALLEVLDSSTPDPADKKVDLNGIGGSFELVEGTIDFETFEIYELAASVMLGADENYLAAMAGLKFGETSVAGGVFLGRACTRDPLRMIDPLVDQVLTMDTFTGIYGYGEATIPVFGGTCLFNISAKMGAGAFYFKEGPTYGGRLTMGVYGKALCAVEVGGEVSLAGAKSGREYNFAGYGRVYGAAGVKPFRVEADFQVDFTYSTATDKFQIDY